jgi:hypothetical protein
MHMPTHAPQEQHIANHTGTLATQAACGVHCSRATPAHPRATCSDTRVGKQRTKTHAGPPCNTSCMWHALFAGRIRPHAPSTCSSARVDIQQLVRCSTHATQHMTAVCKPGLASSKCSAAGACARTCPSAAHRKNMLDSARHKLHPHSATQHAQMPGLTYSTPQSMQDPLSHMLHAACTVAVASAQRHTTCSDARVDIQHTAEHAGPCARSCNRHALMRPNTPHSSRTEQRGTPDRHGLLLAASAGTHTACSDARVDIQQLVGCCTNVSLHHPSDSLAVG